LVHTIAEITGTSSKIQVGALPYRPNEIWRMRGDSTRAQNILGWRPCVNLTEGLRRTVDWYRDQLAQRNPVIVYGAE
jgi:nucleoside-diphosphate-sugar epimerase